jgi:hypothetical protein
MIRVVLDYFKNDNSYVLVNPDNVVYAYDAISNEKSVPNNHPCLLLRLSDGTEIVCKSLTAWDWERLYYSKHLCKWRWPDNHDFVYPQPKDRLRPTLEEKEKESPLLKPLNT